MAAACIHITAVKVRKFAVVLGIRIAAFVASLTRMDLLLRCCQPPTVQAANLIAKVRPKGFDHSGTHPRSKLQLGTTCRPKSSCYFSL